MSMDLNVCSFTGRLGKDPDLREVDCKSVCNFSIAVSGYKESTLWLRINVWGKAAENCERYLSKGKRVAVTGELSTREWEGTNGKQTSVELTASSFGGVIFLETGSRADDDYPPKSGVDQGDDVPF